MKRAELLASRVPRYTSYPTAPHFQPRIGAETYERWLRELPPNSPLSVYVHIPFCDTLCWFCGCHTRVVNNYSPVASYLDLVRSELATLAKITGCDHEIAHLHFGGGSPTILEPADFIAIASDIRGTYPLASGAEFAVEIDPRGLSDAMIGALAKAGVNRASIGVQDISPVVQRAINRMQPFKTTKSAIERLRAADICDLNVDIMYGLPHQTVRHVRETVDAMLSLKPNRLAVFGYAHVPHMKRHMALIDQKDLPSTAERLAQYDQAQSALIGAGYVAIGLDHFALPDDPMAIAASNGTLHRNFQGYTTDSARALLGIGASAISSLPQGYVQNETAVPRYRERIMSGKLASVRGVELNKEDRICRAVIERLMCSLKVDLSEMATTFGHAPDHFADELAELRRLSKERLVEVDGWNVSVPLSERAAVRVVCTVFDKYLDSSAARHALAV
jgi:oxygen-independent coproporphyrinogen-3 oxidase